MSPPKLNSADKQTLVELYRQTPATTATLAERFGVSVSTVSRLLKSELAGAEYEHLVQEKRGQRGIKIDSQLTLPLGSKEPTLTPTRAIAEADGEEDTIGGIRTRRRTRSSKQAVLGEETENAPKKRLELPTNPNNRPQIVSIKTVPTEVLPMAEPNWEENEEDLESTELEAEGFSTMEEEEDDLDEDLMLPTLGDDGEDFENALEDEEDDEEDEDDEGDDSDFFDQTLLGNEEKAIAAGGITIAPFASASMPKNCYLVVDKMGELIVRPLNQFSVRGTIPAGEKKERTLPIFDNHRVARRFSLRTQKVIKIPDADMVKKASSALKAKGITRVFLGGRVYAL